MARSWLKRMLVGVTGNRWSQKLLEKNVYLSQYLMGIGAGSSVDDSGEAGVFALVKERIPGRLCIFDVGANKGQYLNLALQGFVGSDMEIHSFEPSAFTYGILQQNAPQSGPAEIHLNNFGLGAEPGELTLYADAKGSGLASLSMRRLDHFGVSFEAQETVKIETVDAYCEANGIETISLLKLDVEGHELEVLQGARQMLAKGGVQCITFEFGGCNIDTRTFFQDFFYLLEKAGMVISRATPSGLIVPMPGYSEVYEQFRTTNFVAYQKNLLL